MIKVNKKLKYPSVVVLFCSKNHMIFTLCINRKKPCNHKKTTTVYMYSTILIVWYIYTVNANAHKIRGLRDDMLLKIA